MTPLETIEVKRQAAGINAESSPQALEDVQSSEDRRRVRIQKVGIRNLELPVRARMKCGEAQSTVATMALMVDLRAAQRGTHMSRLVDILHEQSSVIGPREIASILKSARRRLDSQEAWFEAEFPFFIRKQAPASGLESLMNYRIRYEASICENKVDIAATVRAGVATLCPCSKAISAHGAHNQRGEVSVTYRFNGVVWAEDVIRAVEDSSSSELYALLKRSDEKVVTERAYENPAFVEDLVRNAALKMRAIPEITWFQVEAENFESIHNHNAYACVTSDCL